MDLPNGANAAGFRPGVCNTLAAVMPTEFVIATTGHDATKASALFEYVDADGRRVEGYSHLFGGRATQASLPSVTSSQSHKAARRATTSQTHLAYESSAS